jgi:germination protein M
MTRRFAAVAVALVLALGGCGGSDGDDAAQTAGTGTTTAARIPLRVYFLRDGKLAAARRTVPGTPAVGRAALEQLLAGRNQLERQAGIGSAVPVETTLLDLSIDDGGAEVSLSDEVAAGGEAALAQVVYTLTQFPTVERVAVNGDEPRTRADFESFAPAILVESPLSAETVRTPVRIRGTANTFEAVFNAELIDTSGRVIATQVVTATSGSGTRGTFDAELTFGDEVSSGPGALVVYETSAEDGSRIHTVEIPVLIASS